MMHGQQNFIIIVQACLTTRNVQHNIRYANTESAVDNKAVQNIVVVIKYTIETWSVVSVRYLLKKTIGLLCT
jgi:hypothetical protein